MGNRLEKEKSPYLLQHANNPVDWYPWSGEAFDEAKRRNCPIFLSVGYSTCHWCHVMERESFEDEEVAAILNHNFVSIKVDREERPDIDHVYMSVCQAMTGQGGWPLTILMTPEKKPFYAGTYFPKHERWGRTGLIDILILISEKWRQDPDMLLKMADKVSDSIFAKETVDQVGKLDDEILSGAFHQARELFDQEYGGFGTAPKFPAPHNLAFLLGYWKRRGEGEALKMVTQTLDSMYRGGIYDHVGFGFSRYATDKNWLTPHFEKMLYDNALLALIYIEGFQATGRPLYARVAKEIFTYVLRDMASPAGGFYTAEDADSEGEEGRFYVWTPAEVKNVLGDQDGEIYCRLFDITAPGNFEGRNIPNLIAGAPFNDAGELTPETGETADHIGSLRERLFQARKKRVPPYKDDKVLTAWNGLMVAALAKGAAVLGEDVYQQEAERAVEFIFQKMRRTDGRLLARYRDGESAYPAYLDDYAFLSWGLLELYGATFDVAYLERARELTREMIDLFWDEEGGGFFFYGRDAEKLIFRPKEIYDGALPSGNSVALQNLLRLALLTGDQSFADLAERQVKTFTGNILEHPWGGTHFLAGVELMLGPARRIVVAGEAGKADTMAMLKAVQQTYLPHAVVIFNPAGEAGRQVERVDPSLSDQLGVDGRATAYICQDFACREPVTDYQQFVKILQQ
ncbi:MAG: thioredoxin domain-containing protein [Peptococcaceae bacterium]|nr:thioredoxin domain-containing protein [Peptococcaceae bacterium]